RSKGYGHYTTIERNSKSLNIYKDSTEIIDLLSNKVDQSFCNEKKIEIIVLEQLLDKSNSKLLIWDQLRKCKLNKAIGRKPIWFDKIEQKLLERSNLQKIKTEWQQNMTNILAPRVELLKIKMNDLEHTTKLKKCRGCQINENLDIAAEHCILRKQLNAIIKIVSHEEELINMYLEESQAAKKLKSIVGQI
ncbi:35065_t:CDS:2, partial [Gigaspora margarita]